MKNFMAYSLRMLKSGFAESFSDDVPNESTSFFSQGPVFKGLIQAVGYDSYDMYSRPPNSGTVLKKIEENVSVSYAQRLFRQWRLMLNCVQIE